MSESAATERPIGPWIPEPPSATAARDALSAFVAAPDAPARADALVALVQAIRPADDDVLARLEAAGDERDRFGAALAAFFAGVDATNLVGVAGIPGQRGFFNE